MLIELSYGWSKLKNKLGLKFALKIKNIRLEVEKHGSYKKECK